MKKELFAILLTAFLFNACQETKSKRYSNDESLLYAPPPSTEELHSLKEPEMNSEGALFKESEVAEEKSNISDKDEIYDNTEDYDLIVENPYMTSIDDPLSTFSIDVDNASYTNMRRYVDQGMLPPKDAVRIEEFINYFDYDYPQPNDEDPFSVNTEMVSCPWNNAHQLVMIGLQGKELDVRAAPASNLVFLVDVSGSMEADNKLGLVKKGLQMMVNELGPNDKVAMVTYAGEAGVALNSTNCSQKSKIHNAIESLGAGGSTNGAGGIIKAYELAIENMIAGGNNRVILCSDGDFNVGVSSDGELVRLIEEKRKTGVYITVCGFGMGNYKDNKMEKIADNGNGAYFYIDNENEAKRVFVTGLRSTLFTIAKDVKIQVEFNPVYVSSYRLIGYENRKLRNQDFTNDSIDAGEIGAGHTVTALYEIVPANGQIVSHDLKYSSLTTKNNAKAGNEVMTVSLRYKKPGTETSRLISQTVTKDELSSTLSDNMKWLSAVASFGMILRESEFKGSASLAQVKAMSSLVSAKFMDDSKKEFLQLVEKSDKLLVAKK